MSPGGGNSVVQNSIGQKSDIGTVAPQHMLSVEMAEIVVVSMWCFMPVLKYNKCYREVCVQNHYRFKGILVSAHVYPASRASNGRLSWIELVLGRIRYLGHAPQWHTFPTTYNPTSPFLQTIYCIVAEDTLFLTIRAVLWLP